MTQAAPQSLAYRQPAAAGWDPLTRQRWLEDLARGGALADLAGPAVSVLWVLLAHANRYGDAWPSVATISALAGYRPTAVRKALTTLRAAELIDRRTSGGGRQAAVYRLRPLRPRGPHPSAAADPNRPI